MQTQLNTEKIGPGLDFQAATCSVQLQWRIISRELLAIQNISGKQQVLV